MTIYNFKLTLDHGEILNFIQSLVVYKLILTFKKEPLNFVLRRNKPICYSVQLDILLHIWDQPYARFSKTSNQEKVVKLDTLGK